MSKKDTLSKNLVKSSGNGGLLRNLNKSLRSCLIKNLHKILYEKPRQESKKVPYEGT